jgi:hypothetical protein
MKKALLAICLLNILINMHASNSQPWDLLDFDDLAIDENNTAVSTDKEMMDPSAWTKYFIQIEKEIPNQSKSLKRNPIELIHIPMPPFNASSMINVWVSSNREESIIRLEEDNGQSLEFIFNENKEVITCIHKQNIVNNKLQSYSSKKQARDACPECKEVGQRFLKKY